MSEEKTNNQETKSEEQNGKPWGLILLGAFFVVSLLAPVVMQMMHKH